MPCKGLWKAWGGKWVNGRWEPEATREALSQELRRTTSTDPFVRCSRGSIFSPSIWVPFFPPSTAPISAGPAERRREEQIREKIWCTDTAATPPGREHWFNVSRAPHHSDKGTGVGHYNGGGISQTSVAVRRGRHKSSLDAVEGADLLIQKEAAAWAEKKWQLDNIFSAGDRKQIVRNFSTETIAIVILTWCLCCCPLKNVLL